MPEGDTIWQAAARIRPHLEGRRIERAVSRWPRVVRKAVGTTVSGIETVGKHLLVHLDDATFFRVHLGMKGRWHVTEPGGWYRGGRGALGILIGTEDVDVVCTFPKPVERIRDKERATHPVLSKLGPDLLGEVDLDAIVARTRELSQGEDVAAMLLNQWVACGLGNVYKSEVLFLERLDPTTPVAALEDADVRKLWERGQTLLVANRDRPRRNTTGRRERDTWVYGQRGCWRCGTRIRVDKQLVRDHQRLTYSCPRCQRSAVS